VKIEITVDEATRAVLLAATFDDSDELRSVELFPHEAEAIGWGLIAAGERCRALWMAANAPTPGTPSAN
jgi:hypothetical protein